MQFNLLKEKVSRLGETQQQLLAVIIQVQFMIF